MLNRAPKTTVHKPDIAAAGWLYYHLCAAAQMVRVELAVANEQALRLHRFNDHAGLRGIGSNAGKLAVAGAFFGFDEPITYLGWKDEGVVHVFPIRPSEDKRFEMALHEIKDLCPIAIGHRLPPVNAMQVDVLDPPDIPCYPPGSRAAECNHRLRKCDAGRCAPARPGCRCNC